MGFGKSRRAFIASTLAWIVFILPSRAWAQLEELDFVMSPDPEDTSPAGADHAAATEAKVVVDLSNVEITDVLISLAILGSGICIAWLVFHGLRKVAKILQNSRFQLNDLVPRTLAAPAAVCISLLSLHYALFRIDEIRQAFDKWDGLREASIVLTATWIGASLIKNLLSNYILPYAQKTETDVDERIVRVLDLVAVYLIWTGGILISLRSVGIEITAFLASMGIIGLAVALAAKTVLSNVLAGVTLTADPNIELGNRVEVLGFRGDVERINIHKTVVRTRDNLLVSIPNDVLAKEVVVNWDLPNTRTRVELPIGVGYDTDLDHATDVIMEALQDVSHRFADDREPEVVLDAFGDDALILNILVWLDKPRRVYRVRDVVYRRVLERFREEEIDIPFPQRVIHHASTPDDASPDGASTSKPTKLAATAKE